MAACGMTVFSCGVGFALVAASAAVTAAGEARGVGLKELNFSREPLTSILRPSGGTTLTPQQAKQALETRGFQDVGAPLARGHVAIMAATARRGERVTLVIDLTSGEIAGVRLQAVPDSKQSEKR